MSINQIAKEFGEIYFEVKETTKAKEECQRELFKAFDQVSQQSTLPLQTVTVPIDNATTYVADYYPGWKIESVDGDQAILVQDSSLTAYTHINTDDGYVYGRTQVVGTPSLDDDRLRENDPELWERITEWPEPWYSLVYNALANYITERYNDIDALIDEYFRNREIQRVLVDLNSISDDDLQSVEEYMLPGKVSVRLVPPRQAKLEELEGVQTKD